MKIESLIATACGQWTRHNPVEDADLVIYFGARARLAERDWNGDLRRLHPRAIVVGCSTGGQIVGERICDQDVVGVAVKFAATRVRLYRGRVDAAETSRATGEAIGWSLAQADLAGILVLSDGLNVNGSELVAGIAASTPANVRIAGGLAGDGDRFEMTLVDADEGPQPGAIAAIGFYGEAIRIGYGSGGGWDVFGPHRRITKAHGNVLEEIDGKPALDLYDRYLGDEAAGMPSTALLFPLSICDPAQRGHEVVRTVLGIDRERGTMTFAGDMPVGWWAQLMRGQFDRLANSAGDAARQAHIEADGDRLALLISCIGRRLLMGQRIGEELNAAQRGLGAGFHTIGFYSYGEISPHSGSGIAQLHNQTMTVLQIGEAGAFP